MTTNTLSATDYIELNRLNTKLKKTPNLPLDEKISIKNKLLKALGEQRSFFNREEGEARGEINALYAEKKHLENVESLKFRNLEGYTDNDKQLMAELKNTDMEKYNKLTLNHRIDFQKDCIVYTYHVGKTIKMDRKDMSGILGVKGYTLAEAEGLAKKEGKKLLVDQLFKLSEVYGKEFIFKLFNLSEGNYWAHYYQEDKNLGRVMHTNNLGIMRPVQKRGCSISETGYSQPLDKVPVNNKAFVRLFQEIDEFEGKRGGTETLI